MIGWPLMFAALACALDALSTVQLIRRGGRESWSAWIIGEYPSPARIWGWVFVFPVALVAELLHFAPDLWWVAYAIGVLRIGVAWRNHRLRRRLPIAAAPVGWPIVGVSPDHDQVPVADDMGDWHNLRP